MPSPADPVEYRQARFRVMPGATELLLVRHGESAPARPGERFPLVGGHGDPPLAPEGLTQAERVAARLAREDFHAIYVTTLRRTHETAAPLATRAGMTPIVEPDLREVYLGEWEGGLLRQKAADDDPIFRAVVEDQDWGRIPGAETNDALRDRVVPAVQRIASAHRDQRVVLVLHGGVIGSILAEATGSRPWAFVGADNGSISHLVIHDDLWTLRLYNETGHLTGDPGD